MGPPSIDVLRFEERYFDRIWGGHRLSTVYGKPIPLDRKIGEAWLISDHPSAVSVVAEGPRKGQTLHELVVEDARAVLGPHPMLTPSGRFPLLLKLLDSCDVLSVQVHPDDATAAALGESDAGKTEMWYILNAEQGSELICGLDPKVTPDEFRDAAISAKIGSLLKRMSVMKGDAVLVEAGTVHALGKGILLAEIQQNSDLTYRVYDWGRIGDDGKPRALHIDKALRAIKFGTQPPTTANPVTVEAGRDGLRRQRLAQCRHFTADKLAVEVDRTSVETGGKCHIFLCAQGQAVIESEFSRLSLKPGQAALCPAALGRVALSGPGVVLDYFT
jgi:mannose-6-phosphate isomerase